MSRQPQPLPFLSPPPILRLSKKNVAQAIQHAGEVFEWCWTVVCRLKRPSSVDDDFGFDIADFQFKLVEAIAKLENLLRAIRAEQKRLKQNRKSYNRNWLSQRMSALRLYQTAIVSNLSIGRAVGDGFAWFFYEKDRRLISEHLKHQIQTELPIGIGGFGERLMVRGVRSLDRKMAIYHGTTTFLRIGDVSLIDLKSRRVHAIGELKTRKVSDQEYQLMIYLVAGSPDNLPKTTGTSEHTPSKTPTPRVSLPADIQSRLNTQMRRMDGAMSGARHKKPSERVGQAGKFYFEQVADVVRRSSPKKLKLVQAGPALLIGALKHSRNRSFAADLTGGKSDIKRLMDDVPEWAMKIMAPGRPDNALSVDMLGYGEALTVSTEGIPPSWWPMEEEALADVIFGRVMLVTIYNPSHLRQAMEARGLFAVPQTDVLRGMLEGHELEITTFSHFDRLIQRSFMSVESVVDMVDTSLKVTLTQQKRGISRVSVQAQVTTSDEAYEGDQG